MKGSRIFLIAFLLVVVLPHEGCRKGPSQSKKNNKKIKKGKPIPCPLKDC
jgi:hypothetical protein